MLSFATFACRYPDSWYQDITSNKKFFSLAATFRGGIVGMIVAEIKGRTKVHKEVRCSDLLYTHSYKTQGFYKVCALKFTVC